MTTKENELPSVHSLEKAAQAWCAPTTEDRVMDEAMAVEFARILDSERAADLDLLETAWGLIANAGAGNWQRESIDWNEAAVRFRARYHARLGIPETATQ